MRNSTDELDPARSRALAAEEPSLPSTQASNTNHPPQIQLPHWTFPASNSPRSATAAVFNLRSAPHDPSIASLDFVPTTHQSSHERAHSTSHAGLFNNPSRSIFSSGPPTSSISSNTAQASMSTPAPVHSLHPLAALSSPLPSSSSRGAHYQGENAQSHRKSRVSRAEKDTDNPLASHDHAAGATSRGVSTPTALAKLFVSQESNTIVSRNGSYLRTASGTAYTRASMGETAPLPNHLYNQGLIGGKHSDIIIRAFGTSYALHRLLLDRAPFFSSALSEPWFEATAKEMTLHPEDIDSNITQAAFELALKRLYGCSVVTEEDKEAVGLFATGCWLEMPDLIDASVTSILKQMSTSKLGSLIKLVTANYYGKHGERILASAKAMLCREGWEMPLRYWDEIPGEIAREIIGGDGFFVAGEWERFVMGKKVLDRKLKLRAIEAGLFETNGRPQRAPVDAMMFHTIRFESVYRNTSFNGRIPDALEPWLTLYTTPDIASLLILLNEGIHYVHLSFEQLQKIRDQRDILGLPLMPDKVINDALWMQMELRQKIVNATDNSDELGLSQPGEEAGAVAPPEPSHSRTTSKVKERSAATWEEEEDDELDSIEWEANGKPRKFWIPNYDSTSVMGGGPDAAPYATPSSYRPFISRQSASIDPVDVQWASDFTASASERMADRNEQVSPIAYTTYPPFRFAAEFPSPRNLKEKKRVYSRTVWYAGSHWNVYIQKVETTKNTQLGVYLHRAKEREAHDDHHPGNVDERIGQVEMLMRRNRNRRQSRGDLIEEDYSNSTTDPESTMVAPEQPSRTTTLSNLLRVHPLTANNAESTSLTKSSQTPNTPGANAYAHNPGQGLNSESDNDDNANANRESATTQNSVPTLPAYVDARPQIKTYFKIYCPSKGGRMLSVYESSPDSFNFSQSWGWKSSTMVLDDGLCGIDGSAEGTNGGSGRSKDGRLRFMVVIGISPTPEASYSYANGESR